MPDDDPVSRSRTDAFATDRRALTRRHVLAGTMGVAAVAALGWQLSGSSDPDRERTSPAIDEADIDAILDELLLEEKVGQLTQVEIYSTTNVRNEFLVTYSIGSILSGGAAPPEFDALDLAVGIADLQEYVVEQSRSGIPFAYGIDAVHGNATVTEATVFPHNLGLGATGDPDLVADVARLTGESVAAIGAHWTFSPVADLQRDPRWGRFYEGFSEDPYVAGLLARACVDGYQTAADGVPQTAACVKHFAGYAEPHNGRDRSPVDQSMRAFRTTTLPPFERAIGASPLSVMANSGSVNGVPVHASEWLLTDVLREHLGFDGLLLSDWQDIRRMIFMHEFVPDFRSAVQATLDAGVDVYMAAAPDEAIEFIETVVSLVNDGEIAEERIDDSVRRVLRFKAALGLFDDPYPTPSSAPSIVSRGRDLAEAVATASMTLLTNDGALPLSPGVDELLLTGTHTDVADYLFGGWTLGWQGVDTEMPPAVTIHEGIEAATGNETTLVHRPVRYHVAGESDVSWRIEDPDGIRDAAADADVAVVAIGEGPYAEGPGDVNDLGMDPAQRELIDLVAETATPSVGVIVAGRPLGPPDALERLDALLMAYLPGTAGGTAVANVLFGDADPGGRLPFTWPREVGQVQLTLDDRPPRQGEEPLFPFGHGLSYTEFAYDDLSIDPGTIRSVEAQPTITVSVDVENLGDRDGRTVLYAYNTEAYGSVVTPIRRVMGVSAVELAGGESTRVSIEAPLATVAVVEGDVPGYGRRVVEAGEYEVSVGDQRRTFEVEETAPTGDDPLFG